MGVGLFLQVPLAWNCKLATLLQKRKLCTKHRKYNGLSLLLLERLYYIHTWCILEIKLGVNLEVKLGVGSKTVSKNSVLAFIKCTERSVLAFLKCMDVSVLVFLKVKCMDGSYWPTSGFKCNLPPLDLHSRGIPRYHSYYARKAQKCPI